MKSRKIIIAAVLISLVIVSVLAIAAIRWVTNPARQLTQSFEGGASFSVRYPEVWQQYIPRMGFLALAEPATLSGTPGPSFSIERNADLMMQGSLDNILEAYLASGPESQPGSWMRQGDFTALTLEEDREALYIDLIGHAYENDPDMHVRLIVTKANNMVVYVITVNAPPATWEEDEPLLMSIVESLIFVE